MAIWGNSSAQSVRRRVPNPPGSRSCRPGPQLQDPLGHGVRTRRGRAMAVAVGVGLTWKEARQNVDAMLLPNRKRRGRLTDKEARMVRERTHAILQEAKSGKQSVG